MKKYTLGLIIFALFAVPVLIFCINGFKPIDSLMGPPKLEGENLEIQLAFEKSVEKGYKLKSPIVGDYRSAYIFKDLDSDGQNEVIVFYSTETAVDIIRMNVLMKIDGVWKSVADYESSHSEIHRVNFSDLNNDKNKEIIVGWSVYQNELSRNLNVYKIFDTDEIQIASIFDSAYSEFDVLDVNGDSKQDIVIFDTDKRSEDSTYNLFMINYSDDKFELTDSFALDSSITSIKSVKYDFDSKKHSRRIFIDGYKTDSSLITDCICYDQSLNCFERIAIDDITVSSISSRNINVLCADIDSDGRIEIPVIKQIPKSRVISEGSTQMQNQSIVEWVRFEDSQIKSVFHRIINSKSGFEIQLPEKLVNKITLSNNYRSNIMIFYELLEDESGELSTGELLFSLYFRNSHDESRVPSEYRFLKETSNGEIYFRIHSSASEYGIDRTAISNMIIF